MPHFRIIALSLASWTMFSVVFGQHLILQNANAESVNALRFQYLRPDDGLVHGFVGSTLRDSRGFLWLATLNGLNRYDGRDFITYRHEPGNPNSLSSNNTRDLVEDAQGNLWISTFGNGLSYFDFNTESFTRHQHDPKNPGSLSHNTILSLHIDQQERLWVGTLGGLNRLDPNTHHFIHYRHDPDDPASLSNNGISAVCGDNAGNIWASTYTLGLNQLDPNSGKFTRYLHDPNNPNSLPSNILTTLHCAPDGMIWIGSISGLSRLDPTTGQFKHYHHDPNDPDSLKDSSMTAIHTDSKGYLWIGTYDQGVSRFEPETGQFSHYRFDPRNPYSLSSDYIQHIQEDEHGMLWVSTYDDVSYVTLTSPRFTNYHYNPLLPDNLSYPMISGISSDASGNVVWLGTMNGGLNELDLNTGKITTYHHEPDDPTSLSHEAVLIIRTDNDGNLWLGTGDGLNRFDPVTKQFTHYFETSGKSKTDIADIAIDSQNRIWLTGPNLRGLHRFDPNIEDSEETLRHLNITMGETANPLFSYRPSLGDSRSLGAAILQTVMFDNDDNLWIGSWDKGVSHLNVQKNEFTHYIANDQPGSLSSNSINMLYQTRDGVIWIASSNGLNRFDANTQTFKVYQMAHGLPNDNIVSIVEDRQGYLWLGTNRGIVRFDSVNETFRTFDMLDGLSSNLFLPRAAYITPQGKILFGGKNGLSAFYPEQLVDNSHKPPVFITDFQLFNQSVSLGDDSPLTQAIGVTRQITLTHEQSVFSFKFAALNLLYPAKNRYAYKLHGFDSDWTYTDSNQRFATYTNLDAGKYTFQVKASNNDGIWNEEGVSIELTILPPWWETWWFRASMVIALALIILGGMRWRLHSMTVQKQLLEKQVRERTQQLSNRTEELDIANRAISELNAQLKSENLRMGAELDVSRRMQKMLLPSPEELSEIKDLDIAVFMEPADEVGGDYYDVMAENDRVMIAIGDVTGHGLESGVMMILVQAGVHTLLADGVHEPGHFITTLNRMVHSNAKRMDTDKNLTLMLLDYQDGQVCFSGQHEELLWVSQDGDVQRIDTVELGFMVGLQRNIERFTSHQERELLPGEGIVLYTDGITEAMNAAQAQYGIERLCEVISAHWHEPASSIQQAIIQDVLNHLDGCKPIDDLTLVVVKRPAEVRASMPRLKTAAG